MGRKSDYKKEVLKDKKLDRTTIIKEKLNKEDISTEEMAVVIGITGRSLRDNIWKLCHNHKETIKTDDFKKGKAYVFQASWNGILTTLISVAGLPQYDNRREQHTLEGYLEHLKILMTGIDEYATEEDQAIIKTHSTYQQATLEEKLYESVLNRIGSISNNLGLMPSSLRFQTLAGINKTLELVPSNLAQKNASYIVQQALYKKYAKNDDEKSVNLTSFKEDLEEYLVSLLKMRIEGKEGFNETLNMEVVGNTILEQMILGNITDTEHEGIMDTIIKGREEMLDQSQIKETLEKVASVLDPENSLESIILDWIKHTVLLFTSTIANSKTNKDLGKELMRQVVTEEVYRNLQEFNK